VTGPALPFPGLSSPGLPPPGLPPVERVLIDAPPGLLRAVVLRDGLPWALHVERSERPSRVGDIHLGRVRRVAPGMGLAFVDIGAAVPAVLRIGGRRQPAPHEGQALMVQVRADARDGKGAILTARLALAGRYLVYAPSGPPGIAASRRIGDRGLRQRLQGALVAEMRPGEGAEEGAVLRTAAADAAPDALRAELLRLRAHWSAIQAAAATGAAPIRLFEDMHGVARLLRDAVPPGPAEIRIGDGRTFVAAEAHAAALWPDLAGRLVRDREPEPLFERFGAEAELEIAAGVEVPLPGGGSLAVERTRALTAIDVDLGAATERRHAGGGFAEAAPVVVRAVARQIVLRRLGGLIAIDFPTGGRDEAAALARALAGLLAACGHAAEVEHRPASGLVVVVAPLAEAGPFDG